MISIIIILAGLILATSGYVQKKGARSRAEAEIAAMSAALESYKADNGIYPRTDKTDALDPKSHFNPDPNKNPDVQYFDATVSLYPLLSGRTANQTAIPNANTYFAFKPQMLGGTRDASGNITKVTFIRDPTGNSYGYSTINQLTPGAGYNPTFDLWSTAGETTQAGTPQWIKNW
ncbi:MAG: hypothetical protein M3128_13035 [Verrucomicrobiota bacterium]|nr:hypothetical protein [Verrucomicrobiota bacterium]